MVSTKKKTIPVSIKVPRAKAPKALKKKTVSPPLPAPVSVQPSLKVYSQQVSMFQNSDGVMRKSFRVVQASDDKVVKTEGVSNQKNASKFHIMRTVRKLQRENNQSPAHIVTQQNYFVISEKDILQLMKEGNRLGDYAKLQSIKKSSKKSSKTSSKTSSKKSLKLKKKVAKK